MKVSESDSNLERHYSQFYVDSIGGVVLKAFGFYDPILGWIQTSYTVLRW